MSGRDLRSVQRISLKTEYPMFKWNWFYKLILSVYIRETKGTAKHPIEKAHKREIKNTAAPTRIFPTLLHYAACGAII